MKFLHFAFGVILYCFCIIRKCTADCKYPIFKDGKPPPGHTRLSQLSGKSYEIENADYKFKIGICTSALDPTQFPQFKSFGVMQEEKNGEKRLFSVGNFTDASLVEGSEWLLVEYRGGQPYGSKCGKEKRKATMMFICDKKVVDSPNIKILGENTEKNSECYYLFEIGHASICPVDKKTKTVLSTLSVGSIVILSFLLLITVYLVLGFIIQRSRGAKGYEQIPNYPMWQELGNLIADGCDLVFRSRPKASNHLYPSMDARSRQTLQPDDSHLIDEDDNDDHMLPM